MDSKPVRRLFIKYEWARIAGQVAAGVADSSGCGGACSAAFSAYITDINGGSFGDALKAAAISYASMKAFNGLHNEFNGSGFGNFAKKVLSHGVVRGLMSAAGGGDFKDGFAGAAVSQAAFRGLRSQGFEFYEDPTGWEYAYNGIAASLVGGVASRAAGGNFEAGARAALFGRLFNDVWEFSQDNKTLVNKTTGTTYKGKDIYSGKKGFRSSSDQGLVDKGPITRGDWTVLGPDQNSNNSHLGPFRLRLSPGANNDIWSTNRNPNSFLIHGDNNRNNASAGCLIAPRHVRRLFNQGDTLTVVK